MKAITDINQIKTIDKQGTVYVKGFYTLADGGGSIKYWRSNEAKQNHNGGTIIDPDHSATPGSAGWYTSENTGTGCWVSDLSFDLVNIRQFGASPDNANNHIQIQTAFDFASENNLRIDLTYGLFPVQQGLTLNSEGIDVFGAGPGATVLSGANQGIAVLTVSGSRTRLNAFRIRNSGSAGTGIRFNNATEVSVYDVDVHNCGTGVVVENNSNYGTWFGSHHTDNQNAFLLKAEGWKIFGTRCQRSQDEFEFKVEGNNNYLNVTCEGGGSSPSEYGFWLAGEANVADLYGEKGGNIILRSDHESNQVRANRLIGTVYNHGGGDLKFFGTYVSGSAIQKIGF